MNLLGNGTPGNILRLDTFQPFTQVMNTIFVRPGGNDITGDGSIGNPFGTFQHAVMFVPTLLPAGQIFRIDITGIDETLPSDYVLPVWKAPGLSGDSPADNPFTIFQAPVEIFATPQPIAAIPLADTIINPGDVASVTIDPLTKLRTINLVTPRASWTAANIQGKQVIDSGASVNNTVVAEVFSTSSILIANASAPTFPLALVEPSAHLHGSGTFFGTIRAANVDCIGFTGIKITSDNGFAGLIADGSGTCVCQLCELETPFLTQQSGSVFFANANRTVRCWIYNFPSFSGVIGIVQSLVQNATPVSGFDVPFFCAPTEVTLRRSVFDGCDPIEIEVYEPGGNIDGAATPHLLVQNVLVQNGNGDGLIFHGVKGHIVNADFAGNLGNGITVDNGGGQLRLENVGSSSPNGGFGVQIEDGMQVSADVATTTNATPLTGSGGGDILLGSVGPVTWATVAAPPNNVADYTNPGATGARVSQQ